MTALLTDLSLKGKEYMKLNGPIGKKDMSIKLELSEKTAQRIILSLVNKGLVEPVGGGKYIKYKVVEK